MGERARHKNLNFPKDTELNYESGLLQLIKFHWFG